MTDENRDLRDLAAEVRRRQGMRDAVRITIRPARRLCLLCLETAEREVTLGVENYVGKLCFALCDDCLWTLKTKIEEAA